MAFEAISKGSIVEGSPEAAYMKEIEHQAYKGVLKLVTVDTRLKDYVMTESSIEATAIRNFIDIDNFKPNPAKTEEYRKKYGIPFDQKVIFVPRRLTKKNGVVYPAMALPAILKKHPDAHLIYAGSGEALSEIKKIVEEHKLHDSVTLLGAIPHDDVKEYYALSDVVLVPSVYSAGVEEATSISALEAMGSGSPLVACAVGGLKEIVDSGKDGLLVEEKNVQALADATVFLLDHPDEGQKMADQARLKIEQEYSHIAAAEKYESIYLKALNKA
jgi:glycosyltransferase involved in cell wall biosynthesis